jgi:acyl dehydratase
MDAQYPPEVGDVYTSERTFTEADVRRFGEVTGDQQSIHTEPTEDGTLVVQGLLTASLSTKIGGGLEVLASEMEFRFRQPVYTGETITCVWTNESVDEREDRYTLSCSIVCTNEDGTEVLTGRTEGLIWKDEAT